MESHSRRGAGLPAPSPTSPRDLPDLLACPHGRRKGRTPLLWLPPTVTPASGLGGRGGTAPARQGAMGAASHSGSAPAGGKGWRVGREHGEKRSKEKRKGVRRDRRCSPVPRPLLPAQRPPPSQTPGRGSPCPAQHQTRPARHAKSPQCLSTGVDNIGARRQQKSEASGEQTPARPEPSGGTGRMLRRSDCSRRPRSPSATGLAQGACEGQERFSSDHCPPRW